MAGKSEIQIGRYRLQLSNLDKVFYPETGTTKGDVIDYYRAISPVLLPHLKLRAVTLKRYPDGAAGGYFYEKECPKHRPGWIRTVALRRRQDGVDVNYCQLNTEAALVWAANMANLELHTSLATARSVKRPRAAVLDLDPGEGTDVIDCAGIALRLRASLEELGLEGFAKTSGSKGLQLYVPLNTAAGYEDTKAWARSLARAFEEEDPDNVISKPSKEKRRGRVFIDWSQNDFHKTTVSVYSLRARPRPTVSTPLTWGEVERAARKGDARAITFEAADVLKRVEREGDLFEPVLKLKQKLPQF